MEERVSARGPTDSEETLILTHRIGMWKSNSIPKTSQILNKFRQDTTQIFASISIFCLVAHPSDFFFRMGGGGGGTVEKWNDPKWSSIKFLDWWSSAWRSVIDALVFQHVFPD